MYKLLFTLVIIVIIYVVFETLYTSMTDVRKVVILKGVKFQRRYRKIKESITSKK